MTKKATIFSERVEEIVEEILNNLQPGKGVSRAALTLGVRQALNDLSVEVPRRTKLLDRGAMREHAKKLFKAAVKLEVLLETAPGVMQAALFSDSLLSRDDLPSQQEMLDGYLKRSESFFDELYRLHIICGQAIGKKWGTHKNYDHAKALSAQSAYNLMKHYSSTKITGTEDGPFRTVTSLFYEALSGFPDADLKRACQGVLDTVETGRSRGHAGKEKGRGWPRRQHARPK